MNADQSTVLMLTALVLVAVAVSKFRRLLRGRRDRVADSHAAAPTGADGYRTTGRAVAAGGRRPSRLPKWLIDDDPHDSQTPRYGSETH